MFNSYLGRRFGFPVQLGDRNQISIVGDDLAIVSRFMDREYCARRAVHAPDVWLRNPLVDFDPANEDTARLPSAMCVRRPDVGAAHHPA